MRRVTRDRFRDRIAQQLHSDFHWERLKYPLYFRKRALISRHFILFSIMGTCFVCGLFSRMGVVLGFSFLSFITLLLFLAQENASQLFVSRKIPARAKENEWIKVTYEFRNEGRWPVSAFLLGDTFSGTKNKMRRVPVVGLAPGESRIVEQTYLCDGGMGVHHFTELTAFVTDPLGVFDFVVTEDQPQDIFVYPELINIPKLQVNGSKDSLQYGNHDVNDRGSSVNFMRIREYVPGDPIKQISWRLSFRHQRLMVKEFEKIVNAEVTILLDMDSRLHAGTSSESTWEYARDTALAIANQQLNLGNSVQILSQNGYIPMGYGADHAHYISLCMPRFLPQDSGADLVKTYWNLIPRSSTLFYISPWFDPRESETLKNLPKFQDLGLQIFAVFFDSFSFVKSKLFSEISSLADSQFSTIKEYQVKTLANLNRFGIQALTIEKDSSIPSAFLKWGGPK
jgi:uncharacterized protein (DUF58 family)